MLKKITANVLLCLFLCSCATLPYEYEQNYAVAESAVLAERTDFTEREPSADTCSFTKGRDRNLIISAKAILTKTPIKPGALVVSKNGTIGGIGEKGDLTSKFPKASVLDCPGAVVSPGFVNAHEHARYSYAFPDPRTGERYYKHRDEWRGKISGIEGLSVPNGSRDDQVLTWVEIRHLLGGTTTIGGSGLTMGIINNSSGSNQYQYRTEMATFPFSSVASEKLKNFTCGNTTQKLPEPTSKPDLGKIPFVPHVGEVT